MATKIFIADDHQMMLDGITSLLRGNDEFVVVGTAMTGKDALNALHESQPDILLTDIQMPEMTGIELLQEVRKHWPEQKVMVLSMFNDPGIVETIMQHGANGYILKNTGREELLEALSAVRDGNSFFSTAVVDTMKENLRNPPSEKKGYLNSADLTEREQEIVRLIAQEHSSEDIANMLFISRRTVETHRKNILRKTGVSNVVGLVRYAYENGLIKDS